MTPEEAAELERRRMAARNRPPTGEHPVTAEDTAANVRAVFYLAALDRFRRRLAALTNRR